MLARIDVGCSAVAEMVGFQCIRPRGASIIGWIDFDLSHDVRESRFALVITRSGRIFASKHEEIKAVPPELWPYMRMMIGRPQARSGADVDPEGSDASAGGQKS